MHGGQFESLSDQYDGKQGLGSSDHNPVTALLCLQK